MAGHFSKSELDELEKSKILGVRAGDDHSYTGVWVVVVERRVFVRSWNDKATGWFQAFLAEPRGRMQVGESVIAVRGRRLGSERLRKAVSDAYAAKYHTKASEKWVVGFREDRREQATLELLPA